MSKANKAINESLNFFKRFLAIIKGREDIKNRMNTFLNPDNLLTSTHLSRSGVDFLALSVFLGNNFEELEPLKEYAEIESLAMLSLEGRGVNNVIRLETALSESKIFKNMNFGGTTGISERVRGAKEKTVSDNNG